MPFRCFLLLPLLLTLFLGLKFVQRLILRQVVLSCTESIELKETFWGGSHGGGFVEKYSASKCILCRNSVYQSRDYQTIDRDCLEKPIPKRQKHNAHEFKQDRLDVLPLMDRGLTSFQVTTRHADQNCGIERLYQNQAIKELTKRRISEELLILTAWKLP